MAVVFACLDESDNACYCKKGRAVPLLSIGCCLVKSVLFLLKMVSCEQSYFVFGHTTQFAQRKHALSIGDHTKRLGPVVAAINRYAIHF